MKKIKVLFLLSIPAFATTFDSIVNQVANLDTVKNIRNNVYLSKIDEKAALLENYNNFSFNALYNYTRDFNIPSDAHAANFTARWGDFSYTLNYSNKLSHTFAFNRNINSIFKDSYNILKLKNKIAEIKNKDLYAQNKLELASIYLDIVYLQKQYELSQKSYEMSSNIFEGVKYKYSLGSVSKVDLEKAQISLDSDKINLEKAKLNLSQKKLSLKNRGIVFNMDEKFEDIDDVSKISFDNEKSKTLAQMEKELTEREFRSYLINNLIPTLNVGLSYNLDGILQFSAGLSYNISIFDSRRTDILDRYNKREKEYEKSISKATLSNTMDKNSYEMLLLENKLNKDQMDLLNRELEIAKKRYDFGMISLEDLNKAKLNFEKNYQNLIQAEKNIKLYELEKKYTGE